MVAKTFQTLEQIGEPFEDKGKMYINVRTKNGNVKRVRWYEVDEYMKMYPDTNRADIDKYYKSTKHTVCGDKGFIWVFECDLNDCIEIFRMNPNIRYHTYFGWYVQSNVDDSIIEALKEFCILHKLTWEEVSIDENILKEKTIVQRYVTKLCNGRPAIEKGM